MTNEKYAKNDNYFFLLHHKKKSIAIIKAGSPIIKLYESIYRSNPCENDCHKTLPIYKIPARKNIIAPTISCFRAIHKIIPKKITGILCSNNHKIIFRNDQPPSKTSNEKMAKKQRKQIVSTLGDR